MTARDVAHHVDSTEQVIALPAPCESEYVHRGAAITPERWLDRFDIAALWAALTATCWYAFALVPIQLSAAATLGLSATDTARMVFTIWTVAGVGTLGFALFCRQPIALGSQFPSLVYMASLGGQFTLPQLMGGLLVAGLLVAAVGLCGVAERALRWIPPSIAMAMFVGSVLGLLTRAVEAGVADPVVAGVTCGAFALGSLVGSRFLPPIGLAAIFGAVAAAFQMPGTGQVIAWTPVLPAPVPIELNAAAVAAVAVPVVAYSLTTGPRGVAVLMDQGFPVRINRIVAAMGLGTAVNACFGGGPGGLSNEGGAILAGPEAGRKERRYIAAVLSGLMMLCLAFLAGSLTTMLPLLPSAYLAVLVGLALLRVVANGFQCMFSGPLHVSPLVTFVVAASAFTMAGLGSVIWALVAGLLTAAVVEPAELRAAWSQHDRDAR